jgi:hypothetical protein
MPGQPLRADEREEIRAGIERGDSFAQIAVVLERPTSTFSREVKRNGDRSAYRTGRRRPTGGHVGAAGGGGAPVSRPIRCSPVTSRDGSRPRTRR